MRKSLSQLEGQLFDVAIVGAGINGCATAHLLASQGYSVLLVDKGDFVSGATSKSARILHCGIRFMAPNNSVWEYLAHPADLLMKLGVARQTARSQAELNARMPQRLRPMDLAMPIYRGAGYRGWHVDIGAKLIEAFNGYRHSIQYRRWKKASDSPHPFASALADPERIESLVAFVDQQFHWPERIAIDAALNAEELGAVIRNFTAVESLRRGDDGLWQLRLRDSLDNAAATASAKLVLNFTGAWMDEVNSRIEGAAKPARKIIGMKGIHALVRLPEQYRGAGLVGVNSEKEPFFCLPWGDLHFLGATETPYHGDPNDIVADKEDIDFVLHETHRLLPRMTIAREDILFTWSCVRPITYAQGHPKGMRLPYGIIHDLGKEGLPNLLSITWGIIVTHQHASREIAAEVGKRVSPSRPASALKPLVRPSPESDSPLLQEDLTISVADVRHAVLREHALNLAGVLIARTGAAWTARLSAKAVLTAADEMAPLLAWTQAQKASEVAKFSDYMRRYHNFELIENCEDRRQVPGAVRRAASLTRS